MPVAAANSLGGDCALPDIRIDNLRKGNSCGPGILVWALRCVDVDVLQAVTGLLMDSFARTCTTDCVFNLAIQGLERHEGVVAERGQTRPRASKEE